MRARGRRRPTLTYAVAFADRRAEIATAMAAALADVLV